MSLPNQNSDEPDQYSVVLCSSTYANSPADALVMFMAQMATGNVSVEIHNSDTDEMLDLDDLGDENPDDQINLGLALLQRHIPTLSAHDRIALVKSVQTILETP